MSRFESFIKGLTSPVARDEGGGESKKARRERAWRERRRRFNSPNVAEKKGEVNRRAELSSDLKSAVKDKGAVTKPYDASYLRDISANAIVQAYIDTLSQDVASANWQIKPRDENSNIPPERLAKVERAVKDLHPEESFADVLEQTTRILLELGDATWVKHFDETGVLAEVVPVDSATFFKQVDRYGITEGYVQASTSTRQIETEFSKREVVWFEWSNRPDRYYGQGPLEKASNEVELIEELAEKERLDLLQGSPPGVLSPEVLDEYGGIPGEEDWEAFVEDFRLDEGERHRVGYSRIPVEFTQLVPNYQELQILERSKYWVTAIGAVFKVNPSYAGFDFENTNRATDESQQEAYAQRGFRVTLRQLEEAINNGLIWEEFGDDFKFEFEREQTPGEKKKRAELIESQAKAGKEMANAGVPVQIRDGLLVVEDGEIEEGNVGDSGGGGGFFASTDDPAEADLSVRSTKKSVGVTLSKEEVETLDRVLLSAWSSQIEPETVEKIEKAAWTGDDGVPEYVFDAIREAIDKGAVFRDFESLPGRVVDKVENLLAENLTQSQGWSLDSIVDDMQDAFPGVDKDDLETVARTETASVLNTAREEGYEDRGSVGEEDVFYWAGSDDSRITQACKDLMIATGQASGTIEAPIRNPPGEPVPMARLIEMERVVSDYHFPDLDFRRHIIHPNERKTFVRDVSASTGVDIDVDVPTAEEFAAD